MSFGGVQNSVRHPLRRAHSLDSVLQAVGLSAEQALEAALQDITLRNRRVLRDQDWSGERLPRPVERRMAENLDGFGVNLQRQYSFDSNDSIFGDNMVSPAEMRRRVEEEIARMRRDYQRQRRESRDNDDLGAVGGLPRPGDLPPQPADRYEDLRRAYDELVERHNRMLDEFLRTIDAAEALEISGGGDVQAAQAAQVAAENEAREARTAQRAAENDAQAARELLRAAQDELREARDAQTAADIRIRAAQNAQAAAEEAAQAAEAARQEAIAAAARGQARDRRRTNFGEGDYNIDVTLKIIKEFDGTDPTKLEGFLRNCKLVFSRVPVRDHPEVLQLILTNKLVDRAMRDTRYRDIETMEQLEKELQSLYGTKKSIASLHGELSNLRQKEGEAVSAYGARAETIAAELVEQLNKNIPTRAEQRAVGNGINQCAKAAFEAGLHGQLQTLVRAKDFKTLHEAVDGAIDIARTISADVRPGKKLNAEARKTGGCFKCGEVGHFADKCPEKLQATPSARIRLVASPQGAPRKIGAITVEDKMENKTENKTENKLPPGAYRIG